MENVIAVAVIALAVGIPTVYIIISLRHGKRCIGCPDSDDCDNSRFSNRSCKSRCRSAKNNFFRFDK